MFIHASCLYLLSGVVHCKSMHSMLLLKSGLVAFSLVFNKLITSLRTKIFVGRFNTSSLNAFAKVIRASVKHFVPVNVT